MAGKIFYDRVFKSFSRQGLMTTIGAQLGKVERGTCEIFLPYSDKVTQQQGGFHGGAIGAIADIAGGYASLTVAPEGMEVTTVEYKINFVAAFHGGNLRAVGKVVKEGKRLHVTTAEVFHVSASGEEKLCAVMQQTLVPVKNRILPFRSKSVQNRAIEKGSSARNSASRILNFALFQLQR